MTAAPGDIFFQKINEARDRNEITTERLQQLERQAVDNFNNTTIHIIQEGMDVARSNEQARRAREQAVTFSELETRRLFRGEQDHLGQEEINRTFGFWQRTAAQWYFGLSLSAIRKINDSSTAKNIDRFYGVKPDPDFFRNNVTPFMIELMERDPNSPILQAFFTGKYNDVSSRGQFEVKIRRTVEDDLMKIPLRTDGGGSVSRFLQGVVGFAADPGEVALFEVGFGAVGGIARAASGAAKIATGVARTGRGISVARAIFRKVPNARKGVVVIGKNAIGEQAELQLEKMAVGIGKSGAFRVFAGDLVRRLPTEILGATTGATAIDIAQAAIEDNNDAINQVAEHVVQNAIMFTALGAILLPLRAVLGVAAAQRMLRNVQGDVAIDISEFGGGIKRGGVVDTEEPIVTPREPVVEAEFRVVKETPEGAAARTPSVEEVAPTTRTTGVESDVPASAEASRAEIPDAESQSVLRDQTKARLKTDPGKSFRMKAENPVSGTKADLIIKVNEEGGVTIFYSDERGVAYQQYVPHGDLVFREIFDTYGVLPDSIEEISVNAEETIDLTTGEVINAQEAASTTRTGGEEEGIEGRAEEGVRVRDAEQDREGQATEEEVEAPIGEAAGALPPAETGGGAGGTPRRNEGAVRPLHNPNNLFRLNPGIFGARLAGDVQNIVAKTFRSLGGENSVVSTMWITENDVIRALGIVLGVKFPAITGVAQADPRAVFLYPLMDQVNAQRNASATARDTRDSAMMELAAKIDGKKLRTKKFQGTFVAGKTEKNIRAMSDRAYGVWTSIESNKALVRRLKTELEDASKPAEIIKEQIRKIQQFIDAQEKRFDRELDAFDLMAFKKEIVVAFGKIKRDKAQAFSQMEANSPLGRQLNEENKRVQVFRAVILNSDLIGTKEDFDNVVNAIAILQVGSRNVMNSKYFLKNYGMDINDPASLQRAVELFNESRPVIMVDPRTQGIIERGKMVDGIRVGNLVKVADRNELGHVVSISDDSRNAMVSFVDEFGKQKKVVLRMDTLLHTDDSPIITENVSEGGEKINPLMEIINNEAVSFSDRDTSRFRQEMANLEVRRVTLIKAMEFLADAGFVEFGGKSNLPTTFENFKEVLLQIISKNNPDYNTSPEVRMRAQREVKIMLDLARDAINVESTMKTTGGSQSFISTATRGVYGIGLSAAGVTITIGDMVQMIAGTLSSAPPFSKGIRILVRSMREVFDKDSELAQALGLSNVLLDTKTKTRLSEIIGGTQDDVIGDVGFVRRVFMVLTGLAENLTFRGEFAGLQILPEILTVDGIMNIFRKTNILSFYQILFNNLDDIIRVNDALKKGLSMGDALKRASVQIEPAFLKFVNGRLTQEDFFRLQKWRATGDSELRTVNGITFPVGPSPESIRLRAAADIWASKVAGFNPTESETPRGVRENDLFSAFLAFARFGMSVGRDTASNAGQGSGRFAAFVFGSLLSGALLEMFVRDLVVFGPQQTLEKWSRETDTPKELTNFVIRVFERTGILGASGDLVHFLNAITFGNPQEARMAPKQAFTPPVLGLFEDAARVLNILSKKAQGGVLTQSEINLIRRITVVTNYMPVRIIFDLFGHPTPLPQQIGQKKKNGK